jgi:DNA-binding protein HU-beta/integration host factor subunit beta
MGNVTKKDIVDAIADRTGLTQVDTKAIVECFLEAISKSLREGKNIEIRGFGRFKVKEKKARVARNPRTGDMVQIEAGFKPIFEASKELKAILNLGDAKARDRMKLVEATSVLKDIVRVRPPRSRRATTTRREPVRFPASRRSRRSFFSFSGRMWPPT